MTGDPFTGTVNPLGAEPFPVPFADDAHYVIVAHVTGVSRGRLRGVAQMTLLHCTPAEYNARPADPDPMDPATYKGLETLSVVLDADDAATVVMGFMTAFERLGQGPAFHEAIARRLADGRRLYREADRRYGPG